MDRKEILFIQPSSLVEADEHFKERYPYPPIGLMYLAGIAKMHGYKPVIYDFFQNKRLTKGQFIDKMKTLVEDPIIIGIAAFTITIKESIKIAKTLKEVYPFAKIVLGGPHVTFEYESILKNNSEVIDFIVRNEGESSLIQLLEHIKHPQAFPAEKIKGIAFVNQENELVVTEQREFITNLDLLPLPEYELLYDSDNAEASKRIFVFMTSRGCPGNCVFCSSRAMSGKRYRFHSPEWLISNVYLNHKRQNFYIMNVLDDTFLVKKKRVEQFCNYLKMCGLKLAWSCKSRVDTLKEDVVALLQESNCKSVHIGVESADDRVLKSIDKHINLEQVFDAIRMLKKHKMRPECSFIVGHYSDTKETIEKTLYFANALRENKIGFSIIGISTPFPGTPIFENKDQFGINIVVNDWRRYDMYTPIYYTENFSLVDIKKAQYFFDVKNKIQATGDSCFDEVNGSINDFKDKIHSFINELKEFSLN